MSDLGNKQILSKNLLYYMNLNKKDRNDMCKALSVPYTTFADWTNGVTYPRIDKIEMLANYFGIQKSDLIEDHDRTLDNMQVTLDEAGLLAEFRKATPEQQRLILDFLYSALKLNK